MITRPKISLFGGLVGLLLLSLLGREAKKEEASIPVGSTSRQDFDGDHRPPTRLAKERPADPSAPAAHFVAAGQSPSPATWEPAIREFHLWAGRYIGEVEPATRLNLIEEGRRLARAHRQAIKRLIVEDPQSALRQAVPVVLRQTLPADILAELEERINTRADHGVYADGPDPIRHVLEIAGQRYAAYVYGRRQTQPTTDQDFVVGIAVDQVMAVDESPLRVLEPGEIHASSEPLLKSPTPQSGQFSSVHAHTDPPFGETSPIVEAGGELHQLCCHGYLAQFEAELFGYEGGTGGPVKPFGPIPSTPSTGDRSVLYVRIVFPDVGLGPQTESAAYDMMRQVNDWFVTSSYGSLYLLTTVTPRVMLPRSEAWYNNVGDELDLRDDALATARAMGYDGDAYDHVIFAYQGGPGNFQGLANIAGKFVWLKAINVGTAVHELGHNLGLWHANSWETGGQSIIGPGSNLEYGNGYDWMGSSRAANGDLNACWKNRIGWLGDEFVHQIRESGTYRIFASDQPTLDPARRYAFEVAADGGRAYWGEYRQRFDPANASLRNGLLLNWSPWTPSAGGTQLLDTTPGSPGGKNDAALTIGRTLSDPDSGVHITPVGKADTSPESIDIVVNIGKFPGNRAPLLEMTATQTNCAPGQSARFVAAATDPDGDPLAYAWDFGDGEFSTNNGPEVSKTWNTTGRYAVRCVASDMKGGTASDSLIVTVGSPTDFLVSGQINSAGQPLASVRVHNGLSGSQYRGTFTDSDGTYSLTGLPGGSTTLHAVLLNYSFTAGFANPFVVGSDSTGANFTGQEAVSVSIATIDPTTTEGADTAKIRLTRTGSTAAALGVALANLQGPIRIEYEITPEPDFIPSLGDFGFIIPAGQSYVDIVIAALKDGEIEGPETMTVEIRSAAAYVVSGANSAAVTFLDGDSPLPVVSVDVLDADAGETGDVATFRVSRLGSTTSALTVQFRLSGSAVNGIDYTVIATNVVIPAGQTTTTIYLNPINDTEIEGGETVTLTLSANASYLVFSSAAEATVFIVDDDIPTVSIAATDATASESGQDPATLVITRTGNTSAPLTVNYALSGSAQHGVDYAVLPGVLTIPGGASAGSITVVPIDDAIGETAQTVVVQLRSGTGYVVANPGSATANISDNDLPVVTVGVSDATFGEPGNAGQFLFTTTGSGSGEIVIHYHVTGTATPGVDYLALSGSLSMGRNTTTTVTVAPIDDGDPEDLETVTVTIDADATYTSFLDQTATLDLLDNERNVVNASPGKSDFGEAIGGTMQFHISRQGSTANSLTVNYTMSGTASNGLDYQPLSGTVTIPAGQSGATVGAGIINDSLIEGSETATLTLTPNIAYGLGIANATQYITDDEAPLTTIGFSTPAGSGNENVGLVSIPVILNAASTNPVTVDYAIAGGSATGGVDYKLTPGVLTFPPGVTSAIIPLVILDDSWEEPAQTVVVELKNAWGSALGASRFTYTINDNDAAPSVTVGFAAADSAISEDVSPAMLLVSLTATQAAPVTVHYAPTGGTATGGGVDYTLAPGTLTFAPGETVKFIPIAIINDALLEPEETIIVTLDSPVGALLNANTTHACTIQNSAQSPPIITGQPQSQTVVHGTTVTLSVVASAIPAPDYQWFFNSSTIPGATLSSLSRSNFQAADEGRYHVTVTNVAGATTSQPASLYLDAPLRFTDARIDSNGYFRAQLIGLAQSNRVILASSDLTNWTSLSTNKNPDGIIGFTDTNTVGLTERFYRAEARPTP